MKSIHHVGFADVWAPSSQDPQGPHLHRWRQTSSGAVVVKVTMVTNVHVFAFCLQGELLLRVAEALRMAGQGNILVGKRKPEVGLFVYTFSFCIFILIK